MARRRLTAPQPWERPLFLIELDGFLSYTIRAQTRILHPFTQKADSNDRTHSLLNPPRTPEDRRS
jgi:hypothetical protein